MTWQFSISSTHFIPFRVLRTESHSLFFNLHYKYYIVFRSKRWVGLLFVLLLRRWPPWLPFASRHSAFFSFLPYTHPHIKPLRLFAVIVCPSLCPSFCIYWFMSRPKRRGRKANDTENWVYQKQTTKMDENCDIEFGYVCSQWISPDAAFVVTKCDDGRETKAVHFHANQYKCGEWLTVNNTEQGFSGNRGIEKRQ